MKHTFYLLLILIISFTACKKDAPPTKDDLYPDKPIQASASAINTFQKPDPFYQLYVYRYDPDTQSWTKRIGGHFSTISLTDSTYLGFTNPYVADSGVAMFDMVKLYGDVIGSTAIKTAQINVDQVLQFVPYTPGAKKGDVKVKAQDVTVTKKDGTTFKVGISGSGTYDETTQLIDLEIKFDNSRINLPNTSYKYKLSVTALTL
ncbi:hypothetical protein I5M32_14980 [Pedobacter sp. SD-b]|uniref:Uncharacterized protein n=1 Tax=Pedobacter segetis TaxID=2793069 RepID=A0ABS1BMZ8_9SPHI|nr:hypothetical protein [Pedobacter segetis]MBK0384270.1 hypothetical protein [Pedobacter segetis]